MEKYKKLQFIGQGGYGTVYKANDNDGKVLALKEIVIVHLTQQKLAMARKEVELHRALKHPHIVRYEKL